MTLDVLCRLVEERVQVAAAAPIREPDSTGKQELDRFPPIQIDHVLPPAASPLAPPASGLDECLSNAIASVPAKQRYTGYWDQDHDGEIDAPEEFSAIDHILLSPGLSKWVTAVEIDHSFDPREVSDHFPIIVRLEFPGMGIVEPIRIASLLPNPAGDERQDEAVTLISHAARPVSLAGWLLRDLAGKTWKLDELGDIAPGETKTIRRAGQSMGLNNGGDTVELIDPSGVVVHRVTYETADTDEVIVVRDGPSGG